MTHNKERKSSIEIDPRNDTIQILELVNKEIKIIVITILFKEDK